MELCMCICSCTYHRMYTIDVFVCSIQRQHKNGYAALDALQPGTHSFVRARQFVGALVAFALCARVIFRRAEIQVIINDISAPCHMGSMMPNVPMR